MELFIGALVITWMLKTAASDLMFEARGKTPPRKQGRQGRRGLSGYVSDLWDDTFDELTQKRRAKQQVAPEKQRYGARKYLADRWEQAWIEAQERQWAKREQRAQPEPERMFSPRAPKPAVVPEWREPNGRPVAGRRPPIGERYTDDINGRVSEWTGDAWTPVCSRCNTPITGHDEHGWLRCATCRMRAVDDKGTERRQPMQPANAWDDDPKYRPMQTIPTDLERPCPRDGCGGTMRPVPGTDNFDADGHAMIDTECDRHCGLQSAAYWYWPIGDPPAEDPDYMRDEEDDEPTEDAARWKPQPTDKPPNGGNPTTGGTMSAPTGEVVGIESIRATLDDFGSFAGAAIDSAEQLRQKAEAAQQAAEIMAAGMAAGKVHPDTIGDVNSMLEAAKQMAEAARAAALASDQLSATSMTARQGVEQRDGLVADVAQSTGNAAEREVLMN